MTTDRYDGFTVTLTGDPGEFNMFERYTDRAKRSVELAQEEAADLGHDSVGTGHLLLGLLGEGGGVAFQALDALGVTIEAAHEAVCQRHPAGNVGPSGWLPYTTRFRKVQELALRESIELGHNFIATEHLLLGLIREGGGVGALALADCGTAEGDRGFSEAVRAKVLELLRGYDDAERQDDRGVRLAVNLSPETAGVLREYAGHKGVSVTEAVRRAIAVLAFVDETQRRGGSVNVEENGSVKEVLFLV